MAGRRSWFSGRRPRVVRYEQAVYGSFAFRGEGYAVLAESPGCRPDWLADFRAACQNFGERPAGVAEAAGLFALRLASGPWAVVGVSAQGDDDRGRPGAVAFHGLFLSPREYRKAGYDPFALAGALRADWSASTRSLPPGSWEVGPPVATADDPLAPRIASALTTGRRVAVAASGPIDGLARQVWAALPGRVRARASVATWAFGNGNRFDLLAVPRLSCAALDGSYLDLRAGEAAPGPPDRPVARRSPRLLLALGAAAALAGAGVGLATRGCGGPGTPGPSPAVAAADDPGPPPPDGRDDPAPDPGERRRLVEALAGLSERFGVADAADPEVDPSALMERVDRGLRYRGPFLTAAERARLGRDPGRDAALAMRWDAHVRRFAADRPLPADFRRGPLRWQVGALAWSFHSEAEALGDPSSPRRSAAEIALALGEALAVDAPLRPSPLPASYPALASYLAFLGRLPRR